MNASTRFELREAGDGTLRLNGYACVTGVSYPVGFYNETIARGAFRRTLADPNLDCQLLVNHTGLPLARTTSGTLRLREDDTGLLVDADLDAQDADVQSLARKMRRGDVTEMSFAFKAVEQDWNSTYDKRLIRQAQLHKGDVSVVAYGANDATSAHIRARGTLGEVLGEQTDVPFEERRRRAEGIGTRATGGGRIGLTRAAHSDDCNRCQGDGTITIACPELRPAEELPRPLAPRGARLHKARSPATRRPQTAVNWPRDRRRVEKSGETASMTPTVNFIPPPGVCESGGNGTDDVARVRHESPGSAEALGGARRRRGGPLCSLRRVDSAG